VLYTRLKDYFIKNNLLSQQKYGFCNNYITSLAITDLYENFQNLNKNISFAVFLYQWWGNVCTTTERMNCALTLASHKTN